MKFSCLKIHLERALGAAERFTGKNVTLPILGNVLLETEGNNLIVRATNLEHAIELTVPGDVKGDGRVSVPARVVSSLVQAIQEDKIHLEAKQGNLAVLSDTRQSRVNGVSVEDFPLIPKKKNPAMFGVNAGILGRALAHVLPAVSSSDFKPELGGVLFRASQNSLALAATDTFRLTEERVTLSRSPASEISGIVPGRVCQELVRVLGDYPDEDVGVSLGENQVWFEAGSARVTSRLIEGAFPEYQAIIPSKFEISVFLPKDDFLSAVRSSSIFSSKLQDVALAFSKGTVEITSANPEVGEYRTKLPVAFSGKDLSISFNCRYLLDGMHSLEEEEVFFGCGAPSSPALLRNKSASGPIYVVMPIRLS